MKIVPFLYLSTFADFKPFWGLFSVCRMYNKPFLFWEEKFPVLFVGSNSEGHLGWEQSPHIGRAKGWIDILWGQKPYLLSHFSEKPFSANAHFWKIDWTSDERLNCICTFLLQGSLYFDKLTVNTSVWRPKQYSFACQTLVFGSSNNIVWRVKQYCLLSRCKENGIAMKKYGRLLSGRRAEPFIFELL